MEDNIEMGLFDSFGELELPNTEIDKFLDKDAEQIQDDINPDNTGEQNIEDSEDPKPDVKEGEENKESKQDNSNSEDDNPEEVATDAQDDGEGIETSPNLYSSVAAILHEQGLLPSLDLEANKIESIDDFVKAFNAEKEKVIQEELKARLGEEGAEAVESGLSIDEYEQYQNELSTVNSITDDNIRGDIELSKRVIYQDLINQGLSEQRALKTLKRTIDLGEEVVIEDALDSIKNIKTYTQAKFEQAKETRQAEIAKAKQAEIDREKNIKKSIYDKNEFVKGQAVNKSLKDKIYNNMTKIVGNDPTGNPENAFMRDRREQGIDFDARLYYFYTITDGFKDFSKLTAKAKSSAVKDLEKAFENSKITNNDTPAFLQDGESYGNIHEGDFIL